MSAAEICRLNATETAQRIADGDVSAVEVAQAHLDRIAAVDGDSPRRSGSMPVR
jgi:aspartyl-tRNA(Asn)/glutamyl-tRNA(Gln) amidotransferase subunit A